MKRVFLIMSLLALPVAAIETAFGNAIFNGNYQQVWQTIKQNGYNVPEQALKYARKKKSVESEEIRLLLEIYNKLPMNLGRHTISAQGHEYIHLLVLEFKGNRAALKKFVNDQLTSIATKRDHV